MKNKKILYGLLMFVTLMGIGAGIYFLSRKKTMVMQSGTPETEDEEIIEESDNEVVKQIITDTGEIITVTDIIVDNKVVQQKIITEDGTVHIIDDPEKLKADLAESLKDFPTFDFSALENLAQLDLSGLTNLSFGGALNFGGGIL